MTLYGVIIVLSHIRTAYIKYRKLMSHQVTKLKSGSHTAKDV